ncbi:MAG: family 20 glycosylhydrolase [Eubacteriales bacterium]
MRRNQRLRRLLTLVLAVLFAAAPLPVCAQSSAGWAFASDTEIYWVQTDDSQYTNEDLRAQVQLFAQELQAKNLTASVPGITYGVQSAAGDHDIVLILDSSLGIAAEGFRLEISGGQLLVNASDADGLFYGCRFVEQTLLTGRDLSQVCGVVNSPDYPERAFFLDCGRKYYSPEWIKNMIREMSWSNMNAIYLHFSEEMGFRLESKTYPWLAGGDNTLCVGGASAADADENNKYITQEEMREIAEVARLYHVEIIPSLDSPGHMNYAVKKYNAVNGSDIGNYFHYNGKTAIVQGSGTETAQKSYSRGIDISNPEARTFAQNLYREYAAFFAELGCTKFDIGGDELLGWGSAVVSTSSVSRWQQLDHWKTYAQQRSGSSKAVAYDAFMYYMNDIYDIVKGYGYTSIRMWNDDALRTADTGWNQVVTLNEGFEIQYWTPTANNSKNNINSYLNAGYDVYNFLNSYNYYVLGKVHDGTGDYPGCTPERIYMNWAPNIFTPYGGSAADTSITDTRVKGSAFCVWCDQPKTEGEVVVRATVLPRLRANGAKAWDADLQSSLSYSDWYARQEKLGDAPANLPAAPEIQVYISPDLTALKKAVAEYESMDGALYTEESFALYTEAAETGKTVLNSKRPTQEQADAATSALEAAKAALRLSTSIDYAALDAELAAFDAVSAADYTAETYTAYKVMAESARLLRSRTDATQEEIDAVADRLAYLKKQLRAVDAITGENCILSFASMSSYAMRGKVFIFAVTVLTDAEIDHFEIYDEAGSRVDICYAIWNKVNPRTPEKRSVQIRVRAEVFGQHTYTVYAIRADGTRSPDMKSLTVLVK